MRTIMLIAATLALNLIAAIALPPASAQEADDADHQALRELKAVFEKAASENNLDLLKPHLHEPFSAVTYTDREFTDFEAFKARWQKTRDEVVGEGGSYKVTLKPQRSEIYSEWAITRGDSDNTLITGAGKDYHFTSHWTAVCRKVDGQWKIVRAHSSLDPFGNPMLVATVWQRVIQVGIGATIGGIILGALVTWFLPFKRGRKTAPSS